MSKKRGTDASCWARRLLMMGGHWSVLFIAIQQSEYIDADVSLCCGHQWRVFFSFSFSRVVGATLRNVGIARSIGPLCYSIIPLLLLLLLLEMKKKHREHTHKLSRNYKYDTRKKRGWKMLLLLYCVRLAEWNLYMPYTQSSFFCVVALIYTTRYSLLLLWICFFLSPIEFHILPGISNVPKPIFVLITRPVTFTLKCVV